MFKRGDRVVLVRTLAAPHDVAAGTLGTVLTACPHGDGEMLVKVAFDGHLLKGGVNVSGYDLRVVPAHVGDPLAGLPVDKLSDVA